jgi:hypothetical protein
VHLYRASSDAAPWVIRDPAILRAAVEEQEQNQEEDPWHDRIVAFVSEREQVTNSEILDSLKIDTSRQGRREQMRVSAVMHALKWKRRQLGPKHTRRWVYLPPDHVDELPVNRVHQPQQGGLVHQLSNDSTGVNRVHQPHQPFYVTETIKGTGGTEGPKNMQGLCNESALLVGALGSPNDVEESTDDLWGAKDD